MLMSDFIAEAIRRTEAGDIRLYYLGNLAICLETTDNAEYDNNLRDGLCSFGVKKIMPTKKGWQLVKDNLRNVYKNLKEYERQGICCNIDESTYKIILDDKLGDFCVTQIQAGLLYAKKGGFCHHCFSPFLSDCICPYCHHEIVFDNEEEYKQALQQYIFDNTSIISTNATKTEEGKTIYAVVTADSIPSEKMKLLKDMKITSLGIDRKTAGHIYTFSLNYV